MKSLRFKLKHPLLESGCFLFMIPPNIFVYPGYIEIVYNKLNMVLTLKNHD
jgi:hypothetical protein